MSHKNISENKNKIIKNINVVSLIPVFMSNYI